MRRMVVAVTLGLLLTGCGKHFWTKSGAGFAEFAQDHKECATQVATFKSADGSQGYVSDNLYRACLRSRGWVRAQQQDPPPPGWFRGVEDEGLTRLDAPPTQPAPASAAAPAGSGPARPYGR